MFGTILISVCTVMQIHVFWRAATVPMVKQHIPLKGLIGAGVFLWVMLVAGRFLHHSTGSAAVVIEFFSMQWMGALFLFFVSISAAELVTGFGFILRRLAPSLRGWALVAGALLSVAAVVQGIRSPVVHRYEVRLESLPEEMNGAVLMAMSDLHLGSILGAKWLAARVAQVRDEQPDLVVMLGDIFEGHSRPGRELIAGMQKLSAPLGVWAVLGNHEFHGGRKDSEAAFEAAGLQLLRNRWVEVRPGVLLAGVDDLSSHYRAGLDGDPVSEALSGRPPGVTILLSHTPWEAEKAARAGTSLMLCGHTHGGQIWPFGYLVRRFYPLLAGQYEVSGMPVIVCRGTGTWGPRMRLWQPGEILHITLRKK
jgi:uncharacterized protein